MARFFMASQHVQSLVLGHASGIPLHFDRVAQYDGPNPNSNPSGPSKSASHLLLHLPVSVSVSNLNPHLARRRLALLLPDPESSSCELALAVAAMAIKRTKAEKKVAYDKKLCQLLDEYTKVLIAVADNVGSNQLQEIRKGLRGDSIVLMGKNTLIRRCIKVHADNTGNKDFLELMPLLVGNVGLIFTKGDLKEVREEVAKYKVGAPARVGLVAPVDVVVPPGNTGLDPSQTSFFQVLNIPTKINKGTVEIITPVELIKKGDKVGSSESALLAKLGIRPFSYGLVITNVYDSGSVFSPEVLDLTEEDLMEKFASGVSMVASVSLAISYPTIAAAPHMFLNGYKNVLAVAVETEYSYPHADKIKEYLKDPSKFAVAAPVAAADSGAAAVAASKEEEKKEEPEEESDVKNYLGLSVYPTISMGSGSEEAAPLLLPVAAATATAEERCPGCVQERRKASRGGRIPYTELFFVAVRDLQVAQTEEDIGVIFNTLFGLSTKYWMALTTRFVLGALNGLLAPIKVNTAWGLGLVVGPALGGYLAQETIHKHKSPDKDIKRIKELPLQQAYWDSPRKKSLFQNRPWMSTMISYCFFGLHDTAYSEILSLWAVSDRKYGGLSFSSEDIGQALSILILSTYPFMTYLSGAELSLALYSAAMMKSALAITISTGICLLQNNAVLQEHRGTANGVSTTAMSFFKAIAPVGADSRGRKNVRMPSSFQLAHHHTLHTCLSTPLRASPLMAEPPATKVYHDGCPGCAMERRKEEHKGIPYREFLFVAITTLASSLPISSLFPFLYFMVLDPFSSLEQIRDLHVARTEEDIGFYAGFLGASYMIGRGFASILWGMVADRIGRKPVIIFSIFAVIVLNTLFGLSVKYWMAVTTRFLLGALNGLLAPIKAYSIEVCRAEHQPLGLSIVSTAWGIGLVVGPATGGYLAQPVKQYPHIFHEKSIFGRFPYLLPCLCISLFALLVLLSCIWLPETLHKHKGLEVGVETAEASTTQESAESHQKSLFRNWPLMSSIVTYCVFSLHDTAYSEIFSLWTVSDRKYGGLSFSSKDVGQVLAVAGASLLVYQLFIYGWVDKILGPIHSTRISAALSVPIIAAYPFMTHLSGIRLGVALYSAAMIKSVLAPQGQRGAANGIATTAMSLFKAIAPAGAGVIFSWAQKRQHVAFFPGDQMVFLLLNLTEVIGLMLTFKPFLAVPQQYK
uniref:Major facilitator superfamily (MFS) profile domain-containing protein n=1 Tax=Oryza nivara TaxID=4536 RepID=A0A0E0IXV7_ORYNI